MRSTSLGTTGIAVTEFFFGAGSIGGIGASASTRGQGLAPHEGIARLDEGVALGVRVVDTADSYGGGTSERTVGEWLREHRPPSVLVSTKTGLVARPDGSRAVDLSGSHIRASLATSVERLGRVDLYLTHAPDPVTPVRETLEALSGAQRSGTISAFGVSNVDAAGVEDLLATADRHGLQRPGWVQNRMNLLDRGDEERLLPLLLAEGLGYTPFSPLAGGVLSDRYLDGAAPAPGSRIAVAGTTYYRGFHTPENLERVARLRDVARELGTSTSSLALTWLRQHPGVTATIVAPSSAAQWDAVRDAVALDLDAPTAERIGTLFAPR